MKGLTDVTQTFNDASVENRVLKANIETLRAKVKILCFISLSTKTRY